jgi:AraC family transcriptional regulator
MRTIQPRPAPILTLNGDAAKGELFVFREAETVRIEFATTSHQIIFLPDGISGLCKWISGHDSNTFLLLPSNTVSFIPANEYFYLEITQAQRQWRMLLLTIKPTAIKDLSEDDIREINVELRTEITVDDPVTRQVFEAFLQEIGSPSDHSSFYLETVLPLTLFHLIKYQLQHTRRVIDGNVRGGLAKWRLKRALQFIEDNTGKPPTLSTIANAVHLHQASFSRAFKQSTGLSPHHYLLIHRVNRAKEMMKDDPDRSLTDIALACGFSSSSQFSIVFKRIVGKRPRQYRNSL